MNNKIKELMPWNRTSPVDIFRGHGDFSLASLQQEMNRLFNHFYNGMQLHLTDWDGKAMAMAMPNINVVESAEDIKVDVELAGMDPKQVSVEIADGLLTISGERSEEKEERADGKDAKYLRREISCGAFTRTLALPDTADGDKAKASFKNGILTVSMPRKAEAVQKSRKIEIRSAA